LSEERAQPRIFYGWWLILVCLLIQAVGFGTSLYLYSVLIGSIGAEFTASRFVLMMGVSGMLLLVGLMSPKIGILLDRHPIHKVLTVGAIVMGSGFVLMSFSSNIYHVLICYALFISLGMAVLSPLSCSLLLSRWFVRHRGLALGISALGTQLGGVVFPPIVGYFNAAYDWRVTVVGLGIFILLFIPLLVKLFICDFPEEKNLHPDGLSQDAGIDALAAVKTSENEPPADVSMRKIFTSANFIIVVAIVTFMSIAYSGILANVSLIAVNNGATLARGAFLVSLLSLAGIVSSPLLGRLSDVLSVRQTLVVLCASAMLALLLFAMATDYTMLIPAVICFGFFGGAVVPIWSASLSRLYDSAIYGRVLGASSAIVYSLAALAAPTIGFLYDITGGYQVTFLILLGVTALLTLATIGIRQPD
jgi:MFS family permease